MLFFPALLFGQPAYVNTGARNVRIDPPQAAVFRGLNQVETATVALAMISRGEGNKSYRSGLVEALPADGWQQAATAFYIENAVSRRQRLLSLARLQPGFSAPRLLLLIDSGTISDEVLERLGPALQSALQAKALLEQGVTTAADLQKVLVTLRLPLSDAGVIPFADRLLLDLPDRLDAVGLSLEAAIMARAIQRQRYIRELEEKVPTYLLRAGDFRGALKASEALDPMLFRNGQTAIQAMDWMILSLNYRRALDLHARYLTGSLPSGQDAFSGLPISPGLLRARSAALLYLLGDARKALKSLEAQTKNRRFDTDVGYARLLQAQLLFEDNTNLARQIAEDLTYRAQENSLYLLEYHATVLEGLALQRQGKDYMAWINFVKARGIARSHLKNPPTAGLALGQMLAGLKLNPRGSFQAYRDELLAAEDRMRGHEALQVLRWGLPAGYRPLLWKQAYLKNLFQRKRMKELFEALQHFLERPVLHGPSGNPGGLTGLLDVYFWNQQPSGIAPRNLRLQKDSQLRERSIKRMQAAMEQGAMFLLFSKKEMLYIHLAAKPRKMETGLIRGECLQAAPPAECQKELKPLQEAMAASAGVFFPAGNLLPMSLIKEPGRLDWRVVHPDSTVSVIPGKVSPGYEKLCSTADGVGKARTIYNTEDARAAALLLGSFQRRSAATPVYLSYLPCGSEPRLWDMDRFMTISSLSRWISPSSTVGGAELARMVTRAGGVWVEYDDSRATARLVEGLLQGNRPEGVYRVVRPSFAEGP